MKKLRLLLINIALLNFALAQQLPIYQQYLYNWASVAPSYSGFNQNTEIFLTLQQQMVGFEGAPSMANFYFGTALNENMGIALAFTNERTGNFVTNTFNATYAYFLQLSDKMFINFGLTPMVYILNLDIGNVTNFGAQIDPFLNNASSTRAFAADVGLNIGFHLNTLDIAIGTPQLIGLKAKLNGQDYSFDRTLCAALQYSFNLNDNFAIKPFVVTYADQSLKFNITAGLQSQINRKLWGAIFYSTIGQLHLDFGATMGNILISYSYGFPITGLSAYSSGSHALNIGFLIKSGKQTRQPTVFEPEERKKETYLDQKLKQLQQQLDKERKLRQQQNKQLNRRIDSLKQVISKLKTQPQTPDTTEQQAGVEWVQTIISPSIQFGMNSSKLLSSSYSELDKYAQLLKQDPQLKIRIVVHTDNLGSKSFKQKLSEERAKVIANYLISKGVSPEQVYWEGRGGSEPIASNDTVEGRRKNNRVEISFNKNVLR